MYCAAIGLQYRFRFDIIHCRSYQAMQVGCSLKRLTGARTIFDMPGLWIDERVDGKLWPQDRFIKRASYTIYKRIERRLLVCATHLVALIDSVVPVLRRLSNGRIAAVTVIPCCSDFDHFALSDKTA